MIRVGRLAERHRWSGSDPLDTLTPSQQALFQNKTFLLSGFEGSAAAAAASMSSKAELVAKIVACGGKVVSDFGEPLSSAADRVHFLLSTLRAAKRVKFIKAVALGIPILHWSMLRTREIEKKEENDKREQE